MARAKADQNAAILEYALHHLERERDEIQAKIDHVLRQLGGRTNSSCSRRHAPTCSLPRLAQKARAERSGPQADRRRSKAPLGRASQGKSQRTE